MRKYLQASGKDWWAARQKALERDGYKCQAHKIGLTDEHCDAPPRKMCVHHIKPRWLGGTHDLENLLTVCYAHHIEIHPHLRLNLGKANGYEKSLGEEGVMDKYLGDEDDYLREL